MPLSPGQTLSFYEILGPLGVGGMGEVYRARDTRLEREVAIKVLPEEVAQDEERLGRFEREARTLASLNHPNVAGIYGVGQEGDVCFLALELVPGEDLATRLERGPLPVDVAIEVGSQIAEGLEAAHEAGVVHRDLKPANVRRTPDGKIKILDFGLAKPAGPDEASGSTRERLLVTEDGRLLGTPTYMSPEQARCKPVDRRTDVWAFGCVLYECLTGQRAFAGDSVMDVLSAIGNEEPDWKALPARTPPRVQALLRRCLHKDPRLRLQDMGEARIALTDGSGVEEDAHVAAPARSLPGPLLLGLGAGAALAVAVMLALRPEPVPPSPLAGATFQRLTDYPGTEFDADISPSGDFIAFGSDRDGVFDIWVSQISGGEPVNLTKGSIEVHDFAIRNVGFNHRASHVLSSSGPGARLVAAPITGGDFEPYLAPEVVFPDWTRDGARMVYHHNAPGDPLFVHGVDEPPGEPVLVDKIGNHQHFPVWSVDEEWIFVVRGSPATDDMHLWRIRPDGSGAEQLTRAQRDPTFLTPLDADTVLFTAKDADGSGPWLWSLDLPSRAVRRATVGLEQYTSVAASEDGRRIVATVANPKAALWRVPILDRQAKEADAGLLPGVPSLRAVGPRYGPDALFYLSSRGAGDGLWMLQDGRTREIWSGTREPLIFLPSISPEGRSVALVRRQGSRTVLSILGVESGQVVRVFDGPVEARGTSSWTPSGEWIVVGGIGPDGPGLFRFPRNGGEPEQIVAGPAKDPICSPTEDLIVYGGEQVGPTLPLQAVRSDGTPVELSKETIYVRIENVGARFLPDGSGLVYLSGLRFAPDFWLLDLASGESRQLSELDEGGVIRTFDVTPDGQSLVFDRIHQNSDIVLIELPERG